MNGDINFRNLNICVVGLGVIGGSLAMAIRNLNPNKLYAIDTNSLVLKAAKDQGIIDEGFKDPSQVLPKCDVVIVSLYPETAIRFITSNNSFFKNNSLILDTAGIKKQIVESVQTNLRDDLEFIGTHPMAGKETSGFFSACPELFCESNFIVTPTEKNKKFSLDFVQSLAEAIGCKTIVELTPNEHDRIIAYTSQLPHVIAVALMNVNTCGLDLKGFIGGSFRDATRVADINGDLWSELFNSNRAHLKEAIENFEVQLSIIKNALGDNDDNVLREAFSKAQNGRKEIVQ